MSILKFIERNWGLAPVTHRSRDNFPNPVVSEDNPYVPRQLAGARRSVRSVRLRLLEPAISKRLTRGGGGRRGSKIAGGHLDQGRTRGVERDAYRLGQMRRTARAHRSARRRRAPSATKSGLRATTSVGGMPAAIMSSRI